MRIFGVEVPDVDANLIGVFCGEWDVTPANVVQTVWAMILSRWTGLTTISFGNMVSGRSGPTKLVEEILSPIMSLVPCRVELTKPLPIVDVVREEFLCKSKTSKVGHERSEGHQKPRLFKTAISMARGEHALSDSSAQDSAPHSRRF